MNFKRSKSPPAWILSGRKAKDDPSIVISVPATVGYHTAGWGGMLTGAVVGGIGFAIGGLIVAYFFKKSSKEKETEKETEKEAEKKEKDLVLDEKTSEDMMKWTPPSFPPLEGSRAPEAPKDPGGLSIGEEPKLSPEPPKPKIEDMAKSQGVIDGRADKIAKAPRNPRSADYYEPGWSYEQKKAYSDAYILGYDSEY